MQLNNLGQTRVQTIIMVVSSNPMSSVGTNIKNAHRGDLLYIEWLLHRNMIVDDVKGIVHLNIIFSYMKVNKICNLDHPVY